MGKAPGLGIRYPGFEFGPGHQLPRGFGPAPPLLGLSFLIGKTKKEVRQGELPELESMRRLGGEGGLRRGGQANKSQLSIIRGWSQYE